MHSADGRRGLRHWREQPLHLSQVRRVGARDHAESGAGARWRVLRRCLAQTCLNASIISITRLFLSRHASACFLSCSFLLNRATAKEGARSLHPRTSLRAYMVAQVVAPCEHPPGTVITPQDELSALTIMPSLCCLAFRRRGPTCWPRRQAWQTASLSRSAMRCSSLSRTVRCYLNRAFHLPHRQEK